MENNTIELLNVNEDLMKLIERANEIQNKCTDYTIVADNITMDTELNLNFDDKVIPLSYYAQSQLCGKLRVPTKYFNQLVDSNHKSLAADNINIWLNDNKKEFMLRQYDDRIRGVLSGSYSIFDAPEILNTANEVFDSTKFKLKGSFINEERLHFRLVEIEMLDIEGEDLFAGITIDSSDVGRHGLEARFFIYKQVCTNGLIIPKSSATLFRQKHMGISHEDFAGKLKEGLQTFYEIKDEVVQMIKATAKVPVSDDVEKLVEDIQAKTHISEENAQKVIAYMDEKYAHNLWGLINGLTEVAQEYTLETRILLEEMAGQMLVSA